jgi:hypothetical protein
MHLGANHFSLSIIHHLILNTILCFTHFNMSEEQQRSSKEYSYEVITLPNAVIPAAPEVSQGGVFVPPLGAAHPVYCEPQRHGVSYARYYGPIAPVSPFTCEKSTQSRGNNVLYRVMALHTFTITYHLPSRVAQPLQLPMDHPFLSVSFDVRTSTI